MEDEALGVKELSVVALGGEFVYPSVCVRMHVCVRQDCAK